MRTGQQKCKYYHIYNDRNKMWSWANGIIIITYSYTTNNTEVLPFKINTNFLKIKVTIQPLHTNDHKQQRNEISHTPGPWQDSGMKTIPYEWQQTLPAAESSALLATGHTQSFHHISDCSYLSSSENTYDSLNPTCLIKNNKNIAQALINNAKFHYFVLFKPGKC